MYPHTLNLWHTFSAKKDTQYVLTRAFPCMGTLNSELRAILSFGHPPILRCQDEGGLSTCTVNFGNNDVPSGKKKSSLYMYETKSDFTFFSE